MFVIAVSLGVATPAYAVPPGVEDNGFVFGPAACSDGVTRTFVHRRGVSTWSMTDGTKWKLLLLTVGGVVWFDSGNSAGLDTVVDCAFEDEVSRIGLVWS
jgi:hypothetical protein